METPTYLIPFPLVFHPTKHPAIDVSFSGLILIIPFLPNINVIVNCSM